MIAVIISLIHVLWHGTLLPMPSTLLYISVPTVGGRLLKLPTEVIVFPYVAQSTTVLCVCVCVCLCVRICVCLCVRACLILLTM